MANLQIVSCAEVKQCLLSSVLDLVLSESSQELRE